MAASPTQVGRVPHRISTESAETFTGYMERPY
jgi:hypothetical protein